MHTSTNASTGKQAPENSETRTTAPTVSGLNQNTERLNHTDLPIKRKTVKDSRSEVIAKSRGARVGLKVYTASSEKIAALHAIRVSLPGTSGQVQRQRITAALQEHGSISTFEAMRYLDVFDPRPRVLELRREGHNIGLAWDRVETEAGVAHRIGRYFLARDVAEVTG